MFFSSLCVVVMKFHPLLVPLGRNPLLNPCKSPVFAPPGKNTSDDHEINFARMSNYEKQNKKLYKMPLKKSRKMYRKPNKKRTQSLVVSFVPTTEEVKSFQSDDSIKSRHFSQKPTHACVDPNTMLHYFVCVAI